MEEPGSYLLLVEWDRLEDHVDGFRGSAEYQQWKALLHHFYDPFPTVSHFEPVDPGVRRDDGVKTPSPAVAARAGNPQ